MPDPGVRDIPGQLAELEDEDTPTYASSRWLRTASQPSLLQEFYRAPDSYSAEARARSLRQQVRQGVIGGSGTSAYEYPGTTTSFTNEADVQNMIDVSVENARVRLDERAQSYAEEVERAYLVTQGDIPLGWWLAQDPADVRLLARRDEYGNEFRDLADQVYQFQLAQRYAVERDQRIADQAKKRTEAELRSRSFFGQMAQNFSMLLAAPGSVEGPESLGDVPRFLGDLSEGVAVGVGSALYAGTLSNLDIHTNAPVGLETPEEIQAYFEEEIQNTLAGLRVDPKMERDVETGMMNQALGAMGWVLDKGGSVLDKVVRGVASDWEQLTGYNFLDERRRQFEEELEDQRRMLELERQTLNPGGQERPSGVVSPRLRQYQFEIADQAWQRLRQDDPDIFQDYMNMAGGDPTVAFGFFQADMEQSGAAEEAQQAMWDSVDQEYEDFVREMDEMDYRPSGDVLELLATYGREVPMRLATGFTLLLTDSDVRSAAIDQQWGQLAEAIEREEFSPANALGIERTMVGLALDLGSGIAFDPATWIFGPRAGSMSSRLSRASQVDPMVGSLGVQRTLRDAVRIARSADHSDAALGPVTSWLAETGHLGEFLVKLGKRAKHSLGGRGWLRNDARSMYTHEMPVTTVNQLLDDVDIANVRAVPEEQAQNLATSLRERGFDGALEVTYSLDEGTFHVTDGIKRLAAAERIGRAAGDDIMVPVTIRIKQTLQRKARTWDIDGKEAVLDDLSRYAEQGAIPDELAPAHGRIQDFNPEGSSRVLRDTGAPLGEPVQIQTRLGETVELVQKRGADVGGQTEFMWVDEAGRVRAGFRYDPQAGTGEMWADDALRGERISERTLDAIAEAKNTGGADEVVDILHSWVRDPSKTEAGAGALQSLTQRWLDRLGARTTTQGPAGVKAADLLEKGEHLPRMPKNIDKLEANVGSGVYANPKKMLPERLVFGDLDIEGLEEVARKALKAGATPPDATRLATAAGWGERVRDALRTSAPGRWLERYMSPYSMLTRVDLQGPTAVGKVQDLVFRLWGQDQAKAGVYHNRVLDAVEQKSRLELQYAEELSRINQLRRQYDALSDITGGGWDDVLRHMDETTPEFEQAQANLAQARQARDDLERQWVDELATLDQVYGEELAKVDDLENILLEMYEDYNRTHIATNPAWKNKVDPDTGLVPWEELRRGRGDLPEVGFAEGPVRKILSEEQAARAKELGVQNPERLMEQVSNTANIKTGVDLPLDPLSMIMASEVGGATYTKLSQTLVGHSVREGAKMFHYAWIIDKVFSLSVAARVSLDELLRIFHWGGMRGVNQWLGDRAALASARAAGVLTGRGISPGKGMRVLPKRVQRRIQRTSEFSRSFRQMERQAFEGRPFGYDDIAPGDAGHLDAARRATGGLLQDSGARAALRGPEAFREWYFGPDGARMRSATVIQNGKTRLPASWEDAYKGWETVMDIWFGQSKRKGEVMRTLREAAERVDATGGQAPVEVPEWILHEVGTVRGLRKQLPHKRGVTAFTDYYFDKLLMDPVNFRRGQIYNLVSKYERRRLENLFLDQGLELVPDTELERILGLEGLGGASRSGLGPALHKEAFRRGYVTEGYLAELVEHRAVAEIENMLYVWDQGSRLGRQGRAIFPFGKPWADMMGFWGREVLTRPALRGWIGGPNTGRLGEFANHAADLMPFNPKPLAMTSRLAATDFSVDAISQPSEQLQWMPEVGLGPAEEADFAPLTFFPTDTNQSPFTQIFPGLGILPLWAIDIVLQNQYDPLEDPAGYEEAMRAVGDFIPSVQYQRGGVIGRLLGGGSLGALAGLATDVSGALNAVPFYNVTSELGDIGREINRAREMSALLADPQELADLESLQDPEVIEEALTGLAQEADQRASQAHFGESFFGKGLPFRFEFDESTDQVQDVWIDAGERFADKLGLEEFERIQDPSDVQRRQQADDVRSAFFDLEQWERDLMISEMPSIAVNLVSSWEWTPEAISTLGEEALTSYRTQGDRESLARHRLYVDRGYIRPLQPSIRAARILGMMKGAQENSAKEIYTTAANRVNDALWETQVDPEVKQTLSQVAASPFGRKRGFKSAREVWEAWGALEAELEDAVAREHGITEEMEEFEEVKSYVSIPSEQKAWGTSWPGLDEPSQRFQDIRFQTFDEKTQRIADVLGIELLPGMTGEELYEAVAGQVTEVDTPLYQMVKPAYDDYIGQRSVGRTAWEQTLRDNLAYNRQVSEEVRLEAQTFIQNAARTEQRVFEDETVPMSEQQEIVDEFQRLRMIAGDLPLDWDGIWEGRYQRTFGPLDWTPPEPPDPVQEDGTRNPNAYEPYVQRIVDGDTLLVSDKAGPSVFNYVFEDQTPTMKSVRILGVNARELGVDGGTEDRERLVEFLTDARDNGKRIYLVRDPETFGTNTDIYGRELAWLFVEDEPFYFPDELDRSIAASGGD